MGSLSILQQSCDAGEGPELEKLAEQQVALWQRWLAPISEEQPVGEDPGYEDAFESMREEVGKLSGANAELVIELAEQLLTGFCKDVRVATYYAWARLHRDGEAGLADALGLLAGLCRCYGQELLPKRAATRKAALEWLGSSRMLGSLSLHPEVALPDFRRIVALLLHLDETFAQWEAGARPELGYLHRELEQRLARSGGAKAIIPQMASANREDTDKTGESIAVQAIQSGRDLLDQARLLAGYLRKQEQGWLAGHRLMKAVRWDTIHQTPPQNQQGCTRLEPPRSEARAQLKRLYAQQSWIELLEQSDRLFAEGVNHLWLDVQWYLYQALSKAGAPWDGWAEIVKQDLQQLLVRLPELELLAWSDGSAFADEVTLEWIQREVLEQGVASLTGVGSGQAQDTEDSVLSLEQEALACADTEGVEAAIAWLQSRQVNGKRQQWLLRLLMARLAEQFARPGLALNILRELDEQAGSISLCDWEPGHVFEVKARQFQLLRSMALRSGADKARLNLEMGELLAGMTRLDPLRALVLYE